MTYNITVKLDTKELDRIAAGLDRNTDRVVGMVANTVWIGAIARAPVDTGALMNSLHTEHPRSKTWAVADGPGVEGKLYGIYQELGTWKMAAHPFLTPACEAAFSEFNSGALWKSLFA